MINNFFKKIKGFLNSKRFFYVIVVFYLLQSLFFAFVIKPSEPLVNEYGVNVRGEGVVSDGNRHIAAIYTFAKKPFFSAPGDIKMNSDQLWMGDLERFPSYFYYYALSIPVRFALFFNLSDSVIVLIIRIIGIIFGLVCLITLRKISKTLINNEAVANFSTLAIVSTGVFIYMSPAENYDIFSLMFFWLFILYSLEFIKTKDIRNLYYMSVFFFIGGIAKYTYIPFMSLLGLVAIVMVYIKNNKKIKLNSIKKRIINFAKNRRLKFVLMSIIFIISFGLFFDRVGVNLIKYGSISPKCQIIHSHDECMAFGVYYRNFTTKQDIENNNNSDFKFDLAEYLKIWIDRYYSSTLKYYGHKDYEELKENEYYELYFIALIMLVMTIWLAFKKKGVFKKDTRIFIILSVLVLVIAQVLFNMRTYLNFEGMLFAHQGRYLLSAYGLLYIIMALIGYEFYKNIGNKFSKIFVSSVVIVVVYLIVNLSAIPMFLKYANTPDWYTNISKEYIFKQFK